MSRVLLFVSLLLLALLQSTVFPRYMPFGVTPDLVFLVLFYWFTRCSLQEALIWTFIIGVLMDILGLDPLGAHALGMIPMVVAAQPLRQRPWLINPVSTFVLLMMASLFNSFFLGIVRGGVNLIDIAIQLVLQAILIPILYVIYRRIFGR